MTYTITLKFFNTRADDFIDVVEKALLSGASTWTVVGGKDVLTITGSGTSGALTYKSESGFRFIVATGVHNYKRWCDIQVDQPDSAARLLPTYYDGSNGAVIWRQADHAEVTDSQGRKINVTFTVKEGNDLVANVVVS